MITALLSWNRQLAPVGLQFRIINGVVSLPLPRLIQHVNASGLLLMSQKDIAEQPTPPDVINYRIEIEQDGKKKWFSMNDVTAPIAVRPLLGFLRKLALEARQPKK